MKTMFIDADACKKSIRDYLIHIVNRGSNNDLQLIIVSDRAIPNIPQFERISCIIVAQGENATDSYIIAHAREHDLVITRDIDMAEQLLNNKVSVINEMAEVYSLDTINMRKKRAILNASQRIFFRKEENISRLTYEKKQKEEKKFFVKFAHYLNTWKQHYSS